MAKNERTKEQKLADRAKIARLALFGNPTQKQIAAQVGLDQTTVSRELKAIREQWAAEAQADIKQIIQAELKKLDVLELEIMGQWERSKLDYQKETVESKPTTKGTGKTTKKERGGQCGDPRYMQIMLSIQERRAKLLGMDKPTKSAHVSKIIDDVAKLSDDELDAELESLNSEIAELAASIEKQNADT